MTSQRAKNYETKLLVALEELGLEIWEAHIDSVREQDVNPRVQSPQMFEQLIETIKKHNRLESLPLVAKRENEGVIWFELISGHHRVRAAKAAGLQTIIVLADTTGLDQDGIISKQLAHNNIDGKTDAQLANRLYEKIQSIDYKIEAFMKELEQSKTFEVAMSAANARIDWRTITFLFLPKSIENLDLLIDTLNTPEIIYLGSKEDHQNLIDAIGKIKSVKGIKNTGAVINYMIECSLNEIVRQAGIEPTSQD